MELHTMGISYRHEGDFYIERPHGSGDNLLLIFKTPAFVVYEGEKLIVPPDSAVVYSKGSPQIYGGCGDEYVNHWVHFDCNEADIFFERIGAAFDRPCAITSIASAEQALEMLSLESVSQSGRRAECCDLLLRLLITYTAAGEQPNRSPHSEALKRLRAEIYSSPSGTFSISELAARVALSPSHFQTVYKSQFGVSCYEDVLRAKHSAAKHYLEATNFTVKKIAELCGYENDVHFMRQFRLRSGVSPSEFRALSHQGLPSK